jgi:lipopolysaccharide biosynthesis glycosyltransferase
MKVFFATNELTYNSKNFSMLRAAINSCLKNTTLTPYLIYDGENEILDLPCEIIKWKFTYSDLAIKAKGDVQSNAAYLRIDIPTICKNMNFDDDIVLYCDYDVIFMSEIEKIYPKYIACSSEFNRNDFSTFNTGVMFMNIDNLKLIHNEFMEFVKNNLHTFQVFDQSAYNIYFKNNIDILPIEYNWKPYWEWSDDIKILHFHGLKPVFTIQEFRDIPILNQLYNISTEFDKYQKIFNEYLK